ncbi:hypothetical protein K488DRAFT_44574 [Vararia minispora EC-137]|uniref:Uncharacterized protein n=1 Tax=Vararia minispora EC-137 TaxID=1314806 RepID=A0ACB8QSJ2_9AGAM|nr:hypothetical protein K488DRAFT_44574 [Vararia minispora EC-137]
MEPNFDDFAPSLDADSDLVFGTVGEVVEFVDRTWYREVLKRARWMDLIGDYAGAERFVVDGEAVLQEVLDDELLAIGVDGGNFQVAHAIHSMERLLDALMKRGAVFDVVFFAQTRHLTLRGDRSDFAHTSRALARVLLYNHLVAYTETIGLSVHVFTDLEDDKWRTYRQRARPMFFMTNDGGTVRKSKDKVAFTQCILIQRLFILRLLVSEGIAVSLLKGAEFRDMKIFSFVCEQRFDPRASLPRGVEVAFQSALVTLEEKSSQLGAAGLLFSSKRDGRTLDAVLTDLATSFGHAVFDDLSHPHSPQLLWLFVVHSLIIPTLGIRRRARKLDLLHTDLARELTTHFLPMLFRSLASVIICHGDVVDIDGRVFVALVQFVIEKQVSVEELVGPDIYARAVSIWSAAGCNAHSSLKSLYTSFPNPSRSSAPSSLTPRSTLMPFTNPVFDDELASVHVHVSFDSDPPPLERLEFSLGTEFEDVRHWHAHKQTILPKHFGGETQKPTTERERLRRLRAEQRFMAGMQRLAETLTGASGGQLQQIVIPPVGDSMKARPARKQLVRTNASKQGKTPVLSSADKIRLQKAEADKARADAAGAEWWTEQQTLLSALPSTQDKFVHLQRLSRNQRTQGGWLAAELQMYRINLEITDWIADANAESPDVRDRHAVSLLRQVRDAYTLASQHPACVPVLEAILTSLGFATLIPSFGTFSIPAGARTLGFKFTKLLRSKSGNPAHKFMKITEHPVVWQLRLFGEYMDRSMDSQPDERVSFSPDAWQRCVLDCLDRRDCSVLAVAPTSAGKTFISFYAMEKLLKESDTDILVYVSPTKALVNQVAAEVYARFSKDLNGRSCWAVHTRDYRIHDPQKCQILVTVPEMLAIMLLSPPLASVWTPRIKRIILDEIHTIGQHEGGSVWEQIILLAPCPIIGLSATVGEPEVFNSWLESVQIAKGFGHEFILHPHRYSHLRKFAYFPQLLRQGSGGEIEEIFTSLDDVKSTENKRFIHPLTALGFNTTSLPSDLSFEASDALSLYLAMSRLPIGTFNIDCAALDPIAFFSDSKLLTQKDVLSYESALKQALSPFIVSADIQNVSTPLRRVVDSLTDPIIAKVDPAILNTPPSNALIRSKLLILLADLHADGDLVGISPLLRVNRCLIHPIHPQPALLFNFDRNDCEQMLISITSALSAAEKRWRNTSPEWKRKIEQWQRWKMGAKDRQRRAEKLKSLKKSAEDEPTPTEDESWESSFDPDDPSPQFCFVGSYAAFSKSDLEKEIEDMRWRGIPQWALNGLRRGIAVHHAGMNRAYRSLVERLFRVRFLQVVIATGTLALGINAPTKTAVFCGDSAFLTALMYRQCSGRAGRRGFDTLGKVVFFGIPLNRIYRLMLSKLPRLAGTFPLSSTLSLRLFNLLHGSQYSDYAKQAIRSILRLPQISFGSDVGREQLLHHLRFSIDYLRRMRLLGPRGEPINLFGVASHLYYTEPSNFALVALLQSGTIHAICEQHSSIKAQHEIVLLMSNLFGRRYLPDTYTTSESLQEVKRKYPSAVVLRPMQSEARAVLQRHQQQVLDVFTTYAVTFAEQHDGDLPSDDTLPLSRVEYKDRAKTSPFKDYLSSSAQNVIARSAFVANSGHVDHFATISELANTVRLGLHLNEHAIPSFEHFLSSGQRAHTLNAYLLDFYTHGQTAALTNANGIRPGEIWFVLQDFEMTLKTVRGNLENLLLRAVASAETVDEEGAEVDSGYFTQDVAEVDEGGEPGLEGKRVRPSGVSDRDWKVLEIFDEVVATFGEKFRAMWS